MVVDAQVGDDVGELRVSAVALHDRAATQTAGRAGRRPRSAPRRGIRSAAAPSGRCGVASNVSASASTVSAPTRMLPCAAYDGPVRCPAQSLHPVPSSSPSRRVASTMPTCRSSRPSSRRDEPPHDLVGAQSFTQQREAVGAVARVGIRLRRDRADAGLRPRNDRADREELRLHGDAPLRRLEIARGDRVRRDDHP